MQRNSFWNIFWVICWLQSLLFSDCLYAKVEVGSDRLFTREYVTLLKGKRVGLLTNHTALNSRREHVLTLLKRYAKEGSYRITALFAPEHGLFGAAWADEAVGDSVDPDGIPIFNLFGKTQRPTAEMLAKIDLLIYDIQDIGSRSYTYTNSLFFVMEEAAKANVAVIVLDRPNPINGVTVDGPLLDGRWRSAVGYISVPYCHGMTVGELARFFNAEYKIGCQLTVIPMQGWKRGMSFEETGLAWVPTSPNIPEASSAWYYPTTGILGELQMVNIGVGYTLPFKLVGAPWINADLFAERLNAQNFPGVFFHPFHYRPFWGRFAKEHCHGVLIEVTDRTTYLPVTTQYLLIGILKSLYPKQFSAALQQSVGRQEMFNKVNGTEEVYRLLLEEQPIVWKLRGLHVKERERFLKIRRRYLLPEYG